MKHRILLILGIDVAAIIVVILLVDLLFDANSFRPQVQAQLTEALGRPVSIGNLALSIWHGGVEASDVSIGEDPAFGKEPFLRAKGLVVGVDLLPLIFSKAVHVNSLTIQEPKVMLLKNAAGKWNFASLGTAAGKKGGDAGGKGSGATDLSIGALKIADGTITVGEANTRRADSYTKVNVKVRDLSYTSRFPFQAEAETPGGGSLKLEGEAGPLNQDDASSTPLDLTMEVKHMDVAATGFLDPSSGMAGTVDQKGTLKSDGKTAHLQGKVTASGLRLVKSGAPARQPVTVDYATDYDVARQAGVLTRTDLHTGKSTVKMGGNYDTRGTSTVVHLKLDGNNLPMEDVANVLPAIGVILPQGARMEGGTVSADLSLDGPIDRLVTTGPISINNTKMVGLKIPSAASAIAGINTGSGVLVQSFTSGLRVTPDTVDLSNMNAVVPQLGTLAGNGVIGPNNALNFKMLAHLSNPNSVLSGVSQLLSFGQKRGDLPFEITGTTQRPMFVPNIAGMMSGAATAPAQGIGGILGGLFGQKKQQQQTTKPK
jgi:AsmA protein